MLERLATIDHVEQEVDEATGYMCYTPIAVGLTPAEAAELASLTLEPSEDVSGAPVTLGEGEKPLAKRR